MHRQRGFTLAEMLVALTLSVLLVSLVYAAMRIGMRSWESTQDTVAKVDAQRIAWLFLHSALGDARPATDPRSKERPPIFRGREDSLVFAADMPSYLGLGGMYRVELVIEKSGEGENRLILSRVLMSSYREGNNEVEPQQALLSGQLKSLEIGYFGSIDNDDPDWHSEWDEHHLPSLIRIRINDRQGGNWPVLIAHPYSSASIDDEDLLDQAGSAAQEEGQEGQEGLKEQEPQ